jgi:hypothetical protein
MKNIHILPTDRPSRLRYNLSNTLVFTKEHYRDYGKKVNQNIYITSDEKPKKGEYSLYQNKIHKCIEDIIGDEFKKIILTTDQDLIKDGVQAIDDEFLKWFVKNPSCEEVELDIETELDAYYRNGIGGARPIKIIIPQEEPIDWSDLENSGLDKPFKLIEETKQETLEEAAYREIGIIKGVYNPHHKEQEAKGFVRGAKWQAERMYSEEELHRIIGSYNAHLTAFSVNFTYDKWFEQFKKKI